MTEGFTLRMAGQADYPGIHALYAQLYRLHRQARPDIYRDADPLPQTAYLQLIGDESALLLAAFDGETVAGCCEMHLRLPKSPLVQPGRAAFIEALAVGENYRRRGLGSLLFARARALARERGAIRLSLNVWSFNEEAIAFYRRMGLRSQRLFMEETL